MFTNKKNIIEFNKTATTSRGNMITHTVYYIVKTDSVTQKIGIGEAAPLIGLSIDAVDNFEDYLQFVLNQLNNGFNQEDIDLENWPAIQFALETALAELKFGGKRKIFENNLSVFL